jgi:hypothetical protein
MGGECRSIGEIEAREPVTGYHGEQRAKIPARNDSQRT